MVFVAYFSQSKTMWIKYIKRTSNFLPMHNKRPSPRQDVHLVIAFSLVFLAVVLLLPPVSLEGSSHRFSPRRNTLCRVKSTSVAPSSVPTVSWTSFISLIEATGAPLALYGKMNNQKTSNV